MESISNKKAPEKRKNPEKQGKLKTLNHGIQEVGGAIPLIFIWEAVKNSIIVNWLAFVLIKQAII